MKGSVILPEGWLCTTFSNVREFVNKDAGKKFYIPLPYGERPVEWWQAIIAKHLGVEPETLQVREEHEDGHGEEVADSGNALPGSKQMSERFPLPPG